MRKPDFAQFLKVLHRQRPDRPTLFEFFLNGPLHDRLTTGQVFTKWGPMERWAKTAAAYAVVGYDYVTLHASDFGFPRNGIARLKSISQNEGTVINDRESFTRYPWLDPESFDYSRLKTAREFMPEGMQAVVFGPSGVLENAINLVGYENLAMMVLDNPHLTGDIFDAIGSRLLRYYQLSAGYDTVGAMIVNDDWGFMQQTMLCPADMRRFVFPWHKKIVRAIHDAGHPAILHSCGNLSAVMDDVIDDIGFDAKHSYEDKIQPVEQAYEQYGSRIAILGGMDVDFVCRSTRAQIQDRSRAMLARADKRGGYALGTGSYIVNIKLELGRVVLAVGAHRYQFLVFHGHAQKLVTRLHELLVPQAATILQLQIEAVGHAQFKYRRR